MSKEKTNIVFIDITTDQDENEKTEISTVDRIGRQGDRLTGCMLTGG